MNVLLEVIMATTIVGICAAIAEAIVGYSPGPLFVVILVGVVGAYLGNILAISVAQLIPVIPSLVLVRIGTFQFDVIWTILGSAFIMLLLSLLRGGRRRTIFARSSQQA